MTRTTTYWRAQLTSNRCMIASDRLASLRPIMRVRCAMSSMATGRPLPLETMTYVSVLTPLIASGQNEREAFRIRRAIPYREAPLFIEREDGAFAGDQLAHDARQTYRSSDRSTIGSSTMAPFPAGLFVGRSMEGQSR